jgi:xanthine dehydrogenase molybdopterin-binding subunit B
MLIIINGIGNDSLHYQIYGACVSEVEVDVLTGEVEIIQSDILYDTGKSLNPALDIGQVYCLPI